MHPSKITDTNILIIAFPNEEEKTIRFVPLARRMINPIKDIVHRSSFLIRIILWRIDTILFSLFMELSY